MTSEDIKHQFIIIIIIYIYIYIYIKKKKAKVKNPNESDITGWIDFTNKATTTTKEEKLNYCNKLNKNK